MLFIRDLAVPFQHGKKYYIWALASSTGNGFLKPDGDKLTASGKADTNDATECKYSCFPSVSIDDHVCSLFETDGKQSECQVPLRALAEVLSLCL